MVLVDTSVWIGHLRKKDEELSELLYRGEVCIHLFIIGEIACGNLKNRNEIISLLKALPEVNTVYDDEAMLLIEKNHLYGRGLGYIDIHLLASSLINDVHLWTKDKTLAKVYSELKF